MKTLTLKSAMLLLGCLLAHPASANIVGYYNLPIYAGDNLIANQLDDGGANTLNDLFNNSAAVPNGTTFTEWNPSANAYLPVSTYNAATTNWSINYALNTFVSGQGGLLHSPSPWTATIVGSLVAYTNVLAPSSDLNWNPNYANGLYLLGCPEPLSGAMDFMFPKIVGRLPQDGEWVKILNPATQTYTTTTFNSSTGWDNGDPSLGVGQAAWVDLGPVVVPEPTTLALAGLSGLGVLLFRRLRK